MCTLSLKLLARLKIEEEKAGLNNDEISVKRKSFIKN